MWWDLYYAVRANDVSDVGKMLEEKPELARQKGTGMCQKSLLLHISTRENHTEISKLLISRMTAADLSITDLLDRSAIYNAAENGNLELCQLLYELAPSSIFKIDCLGHTPLIAAATKKHLDVCLFFLEIVDKRYIEVKEALCQGYGLIQYATQNGLTEVLKVILTKYPDLIKKQAPDSYGRSLLELAAENGHTEVCELFIEKCSYFVTKPNAVYKALERAASNGHRDTCEMFIKQFPDILNVIEPFKLPEALVYDLNNWEDRRDCEEVWEKCGKVIKWRNSTSIQLSVNRTEAWNLILKTCPWLVNKITCIDNTMLHSAARNGHTDVCKLLLEEYPWLISTKIYIFRDTTALHLAVKNGHIETSAFLISHTSAEEINRPNSSGNTILHVAMESYKYKICQLLISKMTLAAVNQVNNKGKRALDILQKNPSIGGFDWSDHFEKRELFKSLKSSLITSELAWQKAMQPQIIELIESQIIGESIDSDLC